jgi:hypothetical protein
LLVPAEKLDQVEEFHACELYGGYGVFEGVEQGRRLETIRQLRMIDTAGMSVVYGAVNLTELKNEVYASADPLDISFRICAKGIQSLMSDKIFSKVEQSQPGKEILDPANDPDPLLITAWLEEVVILIVDECDKKIRDLLQKSFRSLRPPRKLKSRTLFHFHDDMYFGDSRYSAGIQLADLCSYFIARHLEGDNDIDSFYDMLSPCIVFSETYPPSGQVEIPKRLAALAGLKGLDRAAAAKEGIAGKK